MQQKPSTKPMTLNASTNSVSFSGCSIAQSDPVVPVPWDSYVLIYSTLLQQLLLELRVGDNAFLDLQLWHVRLS
jgi:hypothetical protein